MTPAETQLARALGSLADALTAEFLNESLKHAKHADVLAPIRAAAKAVLARFFKRQKRLVVTNLSYELRVLAKRERIVRESAASDESRAAVLAALPDGATLPNAVTQGMSADYASALTAAMAGGYDGLAEELSSESSVSADATLAYLRGRSLEELAAQLEPTTVKRLQTALADAYEAGADFDGLVAAVEDEFAAMAEGRAETIAQTAMNSAYNAGRLELGKSLGFDEKSWACDGPNPCEDCLQNQDQGWIGLDETFSDGSDFPVSHPGCYCSIDVRASAEVLAA